MHKIIYTMLLLHPYLNQNDRLKTIYSFIVKLKRKAVYKQFKMKNLSCPVNDLICPLSSPKTAT